MESGVRENHNLDDEGRPAGGETIGRGFSISWQNGALVVDGERREPNGAFVEDVITAAIGRIEHYQSTQFACDENARALRHLIEARASLRERTASREQQGVEGTYQLHQS